MTQEILHEARGTKNHIIALQAIGRLERQLEFEARLLGELNDSAKVAAGIQVSQLPDVSHLTPEQVLAEQRILRECRERLDALHAGKSDPLMIEAGAVAVVEEFGGSLGCPDRKPTGADPGRGRIEAIISLGARTRLM